LGTIRCESVRVKHRGHHLAADRRVARLDAMPEEQVQELSSPWRGPWLIVVIALGCSSQADRKR